MPCAGRMTGNPMAFEIHKLIHEFERLSLDEKMFLSIRTHDDLDVSVQYDRTLGNRCWQIWLRDAPVDSRQTCSRQHLPAILKAFDLPEHLFMEEISNRLLTQAAFADEFVREVKELLGEEAVRESILSSKVFMDALRSAVQGILGSQESEPTSSKPSATKSSNPSRNRFRLLKP